MFKTLMLIFFGSLTFASGCVVTPTTTTPSTNQPRCSCGVPSTTVTHSRVIGGRPTRKHAYPWMAQLKGRNDGGHICGGAVINSRWVATAAHCIDSPKSEYLIVVGEHDLSTTGETGRTETYNVDKIVVHEYWQHWELVDLALMRVEGNIDLSVHTPLCLPEPDFDVRRADITLAGWGRMTCPFPESDPMCLQGNLPTILQEIQLPVATRSICSAALRQNHWEDQRADDSTLFCWGGEEGSSGCFGDSGSALMATFTDGNGATKFSLAGSVSGGVRFGCGQEGNYGLSWESAKYLDWYQTIAGDGGSGDQVEWCTK